MTKQDYVLIANLIRERRVLIEDDTAYMHREVADVALGTLAVDFADKLAETNPRFDRACFLAACSVRA